MDGYAPLAHIPLEPGTRTIARQWNRDAAELPELVHLDDPAIGVMTDFAAVDLVDTSPEEPLDDALQHMKDSGVRLLLVTDPADCVVGLITARDIAGERPVRVVQRDRITRAELTVAMVMTPQAAIEVLPYGAVLNASVGEIVATLHQMERQHGLVAEVDASTGRQTLRGVFSTTQIGRQLGFDVSQTVHTAHSLAEVVRALG